MVFIWMKNEPTERHGHHRSFSFVDAVSITRVVVTSRLDSAFLLHINDDIRNAEGTILNEIIENEHD
jgi:hypothetical protein